MNINVLIKKIIKIYSIYRITRRNTNKIIFTHLMPISMYGIEKH